MEKQTISKGDLNFVDLRRKLRLDVVEANPSVQSTERLEDETFLSIEYRWINSSQNYFHKTFLLFYCD